MNTKILLLIYLVVLAGISIFALVFTDVLLDFLFQPSISKHILFLHILSVTLFFSNAIVGIIWELKSLISGRKEIILHTYETVSWLDIRFSSLMIVFAVVTGILLTFMMGNIWEIGWLSWSFMLFMLSGLIWAIGDVTTQRKIKTMMKEMAPEASVLPWELVKLLKLRMWISLADVVPLLLVFILMVYKPGLPAPADFFVQTTIG
jgi:uncharacterized membrane protein